MWTICFLYMFALLIQFFEIEYLVRKLQENTFVIAINSAAMLHFFQVWFLSPSFSFVLIKECLFAVLITLVTGVRIVSDPEFD